MEDKFLMDQKRFTTGGTFKKGEIADSLDRTMPD
jgi:hypothetical protein